MDKIYNLLQPEEDELLYSYLLRLSIANGFSDYWDFYRTYLTDNNKLKLQRYNCFRYDSNFSLNPLMRQIKRQVTDFDEIEFMLGHSMYGALAPLLTDYQQSAYVNYVFEGFGSHQALSPPPLSQISVLRYCPECRKDEKRTHGFSWYHRSFQMPEVKACPVHGCPLMEYRGKIGEEMYSFEADSLIDTDKLHEEKAYAEFVQEFVRQRYSINLEDIKAIICKRRAEFASEEELYEYIATDSRDTMITEDIKKKLKNRGIRFNNQRDVKALILKILFLLFDTAEDISRYLPASGYIKNRFLENLDLEGYDLISEYDPLMVKLKNRSTGHEYISTVDLFMKGWRDPAEDSKKNDSVMAFQLVSAMTNGEYKLRSKFQGMNEQITVYHKACGKEFRVKANAFIQLGSRCRCGRILDVEEVRRKIEADGHFMLQEYTDTQSPMKIKHVDCGRVFSRSFFNHGRDIRCPYCVKIEEDYTHRGVKLPEEGFVLKVRALVGEEYTVLDKYEGMHKRLRIRHNLCGGVKDYSPSDFLRGFRCPTCSIPLTSDYVVNSVLTETNGRYIAEPSGRKGYFTVIDTKTGKSRVLRNKIIMQEIKRPTPSRILPL